MNPNGRPPKPVRYVIEDRGYETPCWIWVLARSRGYGNFHKNGRAEKAHRHYYELHRGKIPEDCDLHHRCEQRACVNPDHLEPLTRREHSQLSPAARKTHCKHGHEFTPENTYIRPNGNRSCRTCVRRALAASRARCRARRAA